MSDEQGNLNTHKREQRNRRRPTEPPPSNFRPLWMLILFLAFVTGMLALAALVVDRVVYG